MVKRKVQKRLFIVCTVWLQWNESLWNSMRCKKPNIFLQRITHCLPFFEQISYTTDLDRL